MYHQPVRVSFHKTLKSQNLWSFFLDIRTPYFIFAMHESYLQDVVSDSLVSLSWFYLYFPYIIYAVLYRPIRLPTFSSIYFPALTQRGCYFSLGSASRLYSSPPSAQTLPFLSTIIKRKAGRSKYLYLLTSLSPPSYYTGDLSLANPLHRGRICRYSVSLSRDQGL